MPGIDHGDPGEAVDVLLPILIPDGGPFRLANRNRFHSSDKGGGDVVAVAGEGLLVCSFPDHVHLRAIPYFQCHGWSFPLCLACRQAVLRALYRWVDSGRRRIALNVA